MGALLAHPDPLDQGASSACVGFAFEMGINTRLRAQGVEDQQRLSPWAIYTAARQKANGPFIELTDTGCMPGLAALAISDTTLSPLVPYDVWTDARARIPLDVYEKGVGHKVDFYRAESVEDIRAALARNYPVVFGMDVDRSYEDYTGGVWTGMQTGSLGGHMQCLVGYDRNIFKVANSWGKTWGMEGLSWIDESYLAGPHCYDFYAITASV